MEHIILGRLRDHTGSWNSSFYTFGCLLLVVTFLSNALVSMEIPHPSSNNHIQGKITD